MNAQDTRVPAEPHASAEFSRRLQAAADANPALADRLAAHHFDPASAHSPADLDALPVQSKDELLASRAHLSPRFTPRRIFQSPGPIYEAQPPGPDPWRWGEALSAAGLQPGDVVANCFGYHLSPAGAMFDEAITAAGATVLPAGIGSQQLQVQALMDLGIRGYVGLPSYLKALIDVCAAAGGSPESFPVRWALVTAEPLPDQLRTALQEWVPQVRMAYGSAEAGLIAYEDGQGAGMVTAAGVDVAVCDITTGSRLDAGEGEVVLSLIRAEAPLVRFGTGDLSAWVADESGTPVTDEQGRRRLAGVLGRVGQAVKVRGMFLHPRQAAAVMDRVDGVAAYRFVISRTAHRDDVRCEIVPAAGAAAEAVRTAAAEEIRAGLRFNAEVQLVSQLPDDGQTLVDTRSWD